MCEIIKIAIIDDKLNKEALIQWKREGININYVDEYGKDKIGLKKDNKLSHGTVCCSILIEQLKNNKQVNNVRIIFFSIEEDKEKYSILKFIQGVNTCIEKKVNILSISLGIQNPILAINFKQVLRKAYREGIIIIAAAANESDISYPSCLSFVLGVKCVKDNVEQIFYDSINGLNIYFNLPKINFLDLLMEQYNINILQGNSLLAPILSAEIVEIIGKETTFDLNIIKRKLAERKKLKVLQYYDYRGKKPLEKKEIEIPIIMIINNEQMEKIEFINKMVAETNRQGYNAFAFEIGNQRNDFENNRIYLSFYNIYHDISYYIYDMKLSIAYVTVNGMEEVKLMKKYADIIIGTRDYATLFPRQLIEFSIEKDVQMMINKIKEMLTNLMGDDKL